MSMGLLIDSRGCVGDGATFHQSSNEVILTDGQVGEMPSGYIRAIFRAPDESALYTRDKGWRVGPLTRQMGLVPDMAELLPSKDSRPGDMSAHTANMIAECASSRRRRKKSKSTHSRANTRQARPGYTDEASETVGGEIQLREERKPSQSRDQ